MRLVVAVIRQGKVEGVLEALESRGIRQVTITPVVGCGHEERNVITFRGVARKERRIARVKIEIAAEDAVAEEVVSTIGRSGATGKVGDGVIWVSDLEQVVRVGAERGPARASVSAGGGGAVKIGVERMQTANRG